MVKIEIIEKKDYSGEEPPLKYIFFIIKWNCEMHGDYDIVRRYYSWDGELIQEKVMCLETEEFEKLKLAFKNVEAL